MHCILLMEMWWWDASNHCLFNIDSHCWCNWLSSVQNYLQVITADAKNQSERTVLGSLSVVLMYIVSVLNRFSCFFDIGLASSPWASVYCLQHFTEIPLSWILLWSDMLPTTVGRSSVLLNTAAAKVLKITEST